MAMVLMCSVAVAEGQTVSPVDFMQMNPYQMKANPATDLPYESVMSLVVGNIGLDVQTTTLRYDNLFEFDAQGQPATVNLRQFANSLKTKNYVGFDVCWDLFTLYHRLNKGMLTVNYGIKAQGDATFNDGLFKLAAYGNGAFVGESHPADINMDLNLLAYRELAVGYQINVTEQLSLGGRAKLLFGLAGITTDAFDARLYTDADSYALRLQENIAMRAALPRVFYVEDGQLMKNGPFSFGELYRNPGFGFDFAAEYRFDGPFSLVAAVQDLGVIFWRNNNISASGKVNDVGQFYDNGDFLFNGLEIDQLQLIVSDDAYREQFMDTLQQYFQIDFASFEKYNTTLNTNVLLRANFDLNTPDPYKARHRFSAQAQGRFMGSGFRPAFTVAYSGSFFQMLDVCATYTVMKDSYDNIGLGLAGNFGTFHIYLTTNNLIGCIKPMNASGFNAQVGIVFNLRTSSENDFEVNVTSEPLE
jgi:hypothetical protein